MTDLATPSLVLVLAYWLHMLATVVWIGGLAALALFVYPAASKALEPAAFAALLSRIRRSLQQAGWFSLAVLGVTGMFQMSANPQYGGFLAIDNNWAVAILVKHLVIGLMILTSIYLTWGLLPALQRTALMQAKGRQVDATEMNRLQQREVWLLRLNLLLSALVLALTAWARSAG